MFLENKHTRWYETIIKYRTTNVPTGYVERHHVVPRSLGGTDDASNIVRLTAREHFVCHRLLVKMTEGNAIAHQKMSLALHVMAFGTNRNKYNVTSRLYAYVRMLDAKAISNKQRKRFQDDPSAYQRQVEYCLEASKQRVKQLKNDPKARKRASKISQRIAKRLIAEGRHNFLGGEMQREASNRPEVKQKKRLRAQELLAKGMHPFQDLKFIKRNSKRVRTWWKNATPEQRTERGKLISEGIRRAKKVKEST